MGSIIWGIIGICKKLKEKKVVSCTIAIICSVFLFVVGCSTTSIISSEINYKEISANEYFNSKESDLFLTEKGYKVLDVFIYSVDTEIENGKSETVLKIGQNINYWDTAVYVTDFSKQKNQTDPGWVDRIDTVKNDKSFNGHYIIYLYSESDTKPLVYDIEGIPSKEQSEAVKEAAEKERKAKVDAANAERLAAEELVNKAKEERKARLEEVVKNLTNGYVYHGAEDKAKNSKLFVNGALEEGHAYYISGFVVKYGGSMAKIEYGDGFFFSSQSSAVYVDYVSQKVKAEVIEAGVQNLFGETIEIPLTVVVAGGKGITHTPVVLGIIEE